MSRLLVRAWHVAFVIVLVAGCARGFRLKDYPQSPDLFRASLREFEKRKWDNAILGFERLTMELPARDSLMPRSLYYLAKARGAKKEHLLAAQTFTRLTESFPDDTLADDALFEAGREYARLWRKPPLDPQYGETALSTFRMLQGMYPNSSLVQSAQREVDRLTEWLATKTYETGMFYLRRKAYDPANIYFKEVRRLYPTARKARDAGLRLVESYRAINYREEAAEQCAALRQSYPLDRDVGQLCGPAPAAATRTPAPPADTPPMRTSPPDSAVS